MSDRLENSQILSLRFLGTGDAAGVPVHGCQCEICIKASANIDFRREPCSAFLEIGADKILLDAGLLDLKCRFPNRTLHSILLTHYHPDHVQGLFSLRWGLGQSLPVYGPDDAEGCADLYKNPGILDFKRLTPFEPFELVGMKVIPVPLVHSKITLGYCFEHPSGKLAYLTDTVGLPKKTQVFLQNWQPDLMVLDCSFPPMDKPPRNHNDINLALEAYAAIKPKKMLLTHIGHELDAWFSEHGDDLPEAVKIARDKDRVDLNAVGGMQSN